MILLLILAFPLVALFLLVLACAAVELAAYALLAIFAVLLAVALIWAPLVALGFSPEGALLIMAAIAFACVVWRDQRALRQ